MAQAIVKKAMRGDIRAFSEIRDTIEGRPTQRTELTGPDGLPIMIAPVDVNPNALIVEGRVIQRGELPAPDSPLQTEGNPLPVADI